MFSKKRSKCNFFALFVLICQKMSYLCIRESSTKVLRLLLEKCNWGPPVSFSGRWFFLWARIRPVNGVLFGAQSSALLWHFGPRFKPSNAIRKWVFSAHHPPKRLETPRNGQNRTKNPIYINRYKCLSRFAPSEKL